MIRWFLFFILVLVSCSNQVQANNTAAPDPVKAVTALPTATLNVTSTPDPTPRETEVIPTQIQTPTLIPRLEVCSPLQGESLDFLTGKVVNPFHPPRFGSDDPHQGVDLAQLQPETSIALAGHPVQAVLGGKVVGVIQDRFPYGNAVMVETLIDESLMTSFPRLSIPAPIPTLESVPALTCPPYTPSQTWDSSRRSLYLLYAHLGTLAEIQPGDIVACGESLGTIGSSGNALNPHLHLEVRVGPSAVIYPSMAHYDTSATEAEMGLYCLWRVSGQFLLLDPMDLLDVSSE
jgi:murein DD-endopeptidase MepM/ murein hydrolase activator NlpD